MGMQFKISVCIPFYNCSKYIEDCLVSIAKQTYKNYNIYIFNDGSISEEKNRLIDIINKLNIHCKIIDSENIGLYAARIQLFNIADGDLIFSLDADDYINDVNLFKKITEKFATSPLLEIICFNMTRNNSNELWLNYGPVVDNCNINNIRNYFCTSNQFNNVCSKVFKKNILDNINFNSKLKLNLSEDRFITSFLLEVANEILIINEPSYFYRKNSESIIFSKYDIRDFDEQIEVENRIINLFNKWNVDIEDYARYFKKHIIYYAICRLISTKYSFQEKVSNLEYVIKNKLVKQMILYPNENLLIYEKIILFLFSKQNFFITITIMDIKNWISGFKNKFRFGK